MIRFYPRDIGRWRGIFNFPPKLLPLPDYKEFDAPQEFLDFLTEHKVRFDDPENRLMFVKKTASDSFDCISVYDVHQWTSIGRIEVSSMYIVERLNRMVQHCISGAELHSDKGYQESTIEQYEAFKMKREELK